MFSLQPLSKRRINIRDKLSDWGVIWKGIPVYDASYMYLYMYMMYM